MWTVADVEQRLVEAGRAWADRLGEALAAPARVTPPTPCAATPARSLRAMSSASPRRGPSRDIARTWRKSSAAPRSPWHSLGALGQQDAGLRLKTFHPGEPVALSDVLPMLENLGLRVLNEIPFEVTPRDAARPVWIQEFDLLAPKGTSVDVAEAGGRFEEALRQVWAGTLENDGFNRLVLTAGLSAREIVVLRTYCKHLRQAGSSFSQAYMEDTASAYPHLARTLVRLFEAQFDPAPRAGPPRCRRRGDPRRRSWPALEAGREPRRGPHPARLPPADPQDVADQLLSARRDRAAQALSLDQAREPGHRPAAAAPAAVRDLRLQPTHGGVSPARRQGCARRHPLVRPQGGFPHRDPRA